MARPSTVSTEHILEVALELFLDKGFDVPTSEIARAAGVSEGSIFNRFPTKQDLFVAAMGSGMPKWFDVKALEQSRSVEENLREILEKGIKSFLKMMPRMMLLWSQRKGPSPIELHSHPNSIPLQALEGLTAYFTQETTAGRLSCKNPEIAARLLMGAVANYVFVRTLGVQIRAPLDLDTYVSGVIQTLMSGIRPTNESKEESP